MMMTGDNRSNAINDIIISIVLLKNLVYIVLYSFRGYFYYSSIALSSTILGDLENHSFKRQSNTKKFFSGRTKSNIS